VELSTDGTAGTMSGMIGGHGRMERMERMGRMGRMDDGSGGEAKHGAYLWVWLACFVDGKSRKRARTRGSPGSKLPGENTVRGILTTVVKEREDGQLFDGDVAKRERFAGWENKEERREQEEEGGGRRRARIEGGARSGLARRLPWPGD
jgi:hypothetical protein